MVLKVALAAAAGDVTTRANARQPHLVGEVVVLHEAHEDAGKHPCDRALDEQLRAPLRLGVGCAPRLSGGFVLSIDVVLHRAVRVGALLEIGKQVGDLTLERNEKLPAVDHAATRS